MGGMLHEGGVGGLWGVVHAEWIVHGGGSCTGVRGPPLHRAVCVA